MKFIRTRGVKHTTYMGAKNNFIQILVGNKPEARTALGLCINKDIQIKPESMKCNERGRNILQSL